MDGYEKAARVVNVLDLFSGIGGFSLGLERAGFKTVAFCEIDPYARAVLRKHWPDVPCYDDVRTITAERLAADGIEVQAIVGGFPCQDISSAGLGAGLAGERSGLWREFARLIGELRPRYVIVENVAALLDRGHGEVLGDLARIGYDAEWDCLPASAVGAPHERRRVWIVAYPAGVGRPEVVSRQAVIRHATGNEWQAGNANPRGGAAERLSELERVHREPAILGSDDGFPHRAHRLRCLGNAVVPQIPEIIGRAIMATEHDR